MQLLYILHHNFPVSFDGQIILVKSIVSAFKLYMVQQYLEETWAEDVHM